MIEITETLFAYDDIGRMHNEGVNYVFQKLNLETSPGKVTQQKVLELVAEYMYLIDSCDINMDDFMRSGSKISKIKYVLFLEFLVNLRSSIKGKSITELAKRADISAEFSTLVEMIFSAGLDIDDSTVNSDMDLQIPAIEMLKFLKKKLLVANVSEVEKRVAGILTAVSFASIDYGKNVLKTPSLKGMHETVNSLANTDTTIRNTDRNKFKWPWKSDAEGALGGLVSGGIGGSVGGPAIAVIGSLLGAVGGAVSNSIIRSIPAFNS